MKDAWFYFGVIMIMAVFMLGVFYVSNLFPMERELGSKDSYSAINFVGHDGNIRSIINSHTRAEGQNEN